MEKQLPTIGNTIKNTLNPKLLAIFGTGALLLTGCDSSPELTPNAPGTIVGHEYDDPDTYILPLLIGKVVVPMVQYDPAHYYLKVRQCDHKEYVMPDNPQGCGDFWLETTQKGYEEFPDGAAITTPN